MFKVEAANLREYLDYDRNRRGDLEAVDRLIQQAAPNLDRHFHRGAASGAPGMRLCMIGYGKFSYRTKSGAAVEWPVIGMALQKNYISIYLSLTKGNRAILDEYRGKLGESRNGRNNFSCVMFDGLNQEAVSSLVRECGQIFATDANNPVRHKQGG